MRHNAGRFHFIVSIAIHLLLLLGWVVTEWVAESRERPAQADLDDDPFVFELVETPDYLPEEEPDAETRLVSDRSTRAADLDPREDDARDIPYSDGDFVFKVYEVPEAVESEPAAAGESDPRDAGEAGREPPPETGPGEAQAPDWQVTPDGEIGDLASLDLRGEAGELRDYSIPSNSLAFRNLASSLSRQGGMSFNTYEWDFAPYMLAMKRKVEKNLHPPYAFTHMGMVSGTTLLRFTVQRDGSVTGLVILGSDAHFSLDRSSLRAIELSMPFLPLPVDFPEEVLEVTAQFSYLLR